MKLRKLIINKIREHLNENVVDYLKWKRKNVTLRGIKQLGKPNEVYGSFGNGLYTVPLSNKDMAKQYGEVYFVVNAIPKSPKIVDSLNIAEILRQNIVNNFCQKNGVDYSLNFFDNNTSMDKEMLKMGYVKYFKTENDLKNYYKTVVLK
jgi:hypothetical protein